MKLASWLDRRVAALLLVVVGALLALSPAGTRQLAMTPPHELATAIAGESDHVTAEEVAAWMIDKRPDLRIVDLRAAEEYHQYHLPGAINIPLTQLFTPEGQAQLDRNKTLVLYSNGGTHAAQAWVMLKQLGIDSRVLLGGLNYWTEAILNPQPPGSLVADSEVLKYQFRKSAAEHFGGTAVAPAASDTTTAKTAPQPAVKPSVKKKARAGC